MLPSPICYLFCYYHFPSYYKISTLQSSAGSFGSILKNMVEKEESSVLKTRKQRQRSSKFKSWVLKCRPSPVSRSFLVFVIKTIIRSNWRDTGSFLVPRWSGYRPPDMEGVVVEAPSSGEWGCFTFQWIRKGADCSDWNQDWAINHE